MGISVRVKVDAQDRGAPRDAGQPVATAGAAGGGGRPRGPKRRGPHGDGLSPEASVMTDDEWARVLAGEPAAIGRFIGVYGRLLKLWLHRWVGTLPGGGRLDEDGLVQDLLLALLADERRLLCHWSPERGTREAYLYVVARHRFVDEVRRHQREVLSIEPVGEMDGHDRLGRGTAEPGDVPALESALFRKQALGFVEQHCTPDEWQLLCAFEVEEKSAAEVAEEVGATVEAVYQRKHRLLKRLHDVLEQYVADARRGSR